MNSLVNKLTNNRFSNIQQLLCDSNIVPNGVIHVGAHYGQEIQEYIDAGFSDIILVEANPYTYNKLLINVAKFSSTSRIATYNRICSNKYGKKTLYLTSDDQLCSTSKPLEPNYLYKITDTITVHAVPASSLMEVETNVAVLDVQGSEIEVIEGTNLSQLDLLITEARNRGRYDKAPTPTELAERMNLYGFTCVSLRPHGDESIAGVWDLAFMPSSYA